MNRSFNAKQWLTENSVGRQISKLEKSSQQNSLVTSQTNNFQLRDFLIPDWKGDGLLSRHAIKLKQIVKILWDDSFYQLRQYKQFNSSLKLSIYNQFLAYANHNSTIPASIEGPQTFEDQLFNPNSPDKSFLDEFKKIYSFRTTTVFLFKLKYLLRLGEEIGANITENQVLNPNSFLHSIFRKGSSSELNCLSMWPNCYSWYRPPQTFAGKSIELKNLLSQISISELMKICTISNHSAVGNFKEEFSHSISHRSFGEFINILLVHYPEWLKKEDSIYEPPVLPGNIKVLNTRFAGMQLASMGQAHWLAQYSTMHDSWSSLICPDFKGNDFSDGLFFKICHELQFLCFLVDLSKKKREPLIPFICKIIKQKYSKNIETSSQQAQLFKRQDELNTKFLYERVIINLLEMPKNNPHHFLVAQIQQHTNRIADNGFVFVFSNQKLFVPSQVDKVKQLLENFKLEGIFDFEKVTARGEIPTYFYVLRKRSPESPLLISTIENKFIKKEPFGHFLFSGELSQFNKFQHFGNYLQQFFRSDKKSSPLFQCELEQGLSIEYYQNAVLDGNLVQAGQDEENFIHPSFFRNLTKTCIPFELFFQLESADSQDPTQAPNEDLFHLNLFSQNRSDFQYILVVNFTNPNCVSLEIITKENLSLALENYGTAFHQYFKLIPKRRDININLFKDFFSSKIGSQIIQFSLNGGLTKTKGKLKSLLIPTFFTQVEYPSTEDKKFFDCLTLDGDKILSTNLAKIKNELSEFQKEKLSLTQTYPWFVLSLFSNFKTSIGNAIFKLHGPGTNQTAIFHNPNIMNALLKLKTSGLYPYNADAYTEILCANKSEIHLPLSRVEKGDRDNEYFISLFTMSGEAVRIYCDQDLRNFIHFILKNGIGASISQILANLKIPSTSELKTVLKGHQDLVTDLDEIQKQVYKITNNILTYQITRS